MPQAISNPLLRGLARALGPDTLGAPVDAAEQVVNLGLAGGGFLGHKLGLLSADQLPAPLEASPGTSEWWARQSGLTGSEPAYNAGRMLPLAGGLAAAAKPAITKGLSNLLTPTPRAQAQQGAIRVGGREDLMPVHETTPEAIRNLSANRNGAMELYSPSVAIVKDEIPERFGSIAFIPRVGAFDPAAYPSTVFNRDAYTTRHGDYEGKSIGHSGVNRLQPVHKSTDVTALNFDKLEILPHAVDTDAHDTLKALQAAQKNGNLDKFYKLRDEGAFPNEWADPVAWEAQPEWAKRLAHQLVDFDYFKTSTGHAADPTIVRGNKLRSASLRLSDRFKDPAATRFGESDLPGQHGMTVRSSPAFRSFREYERSPAGAATLDPDVSSNEIRDVANKFINAFRDKNPEITRTDLSSMFRPRALTEMLPLSQEVLRDFGELRKGLASVPSNYAEIKQMGPVPLGPEHFAGVLIPNNLPEDVVGILRSLKIPMIQANGGKGKFEAADALQRAAGPARQHPL